MTRIWNLLRNWSYKGISDIYTTGLNMYGRKSDYSPTFCALGMAPMMLEPRDMTEWDPVIPLGPAGMWITWQDNDHTSAKPDLSTNRYELRIYDSSLSEVFWNKTDLAEFQISYPFSEADRQQLVARMGDYRGDLILVVMGLNDGTHAQNGQIATGPYMSNTVRMVTKPYLSVVAVDSSSSNQQTDPGSFRIQAARNLVRGMTSPAEAVKEHTVPDLVGGIDFDDAVRSWAPFTDPDAIYNFPGSIDSLGFTRIDQAVLFATTKLETAMARHRLLGTLYLFTDGINNEGSLPVAQAINTAVSKGIRVEYLRDCTNISESKAQSVVEEPAGPTQAGFDLDIATAVMDGGGTYVEMDNAEGYLEQTEMLVRRGLRPLDQWSGKTQIDLVRNAMVADRISEGWEIRQNRFFGHAGDPAQIMVNSTAFGPEVGILSLEDGSLLGCGTDSDDDGLTSVTVQLPTTGYYAATVRAPGAETGLYTIALHGISPCYSPFITGCSTDVVSCNPGAPVSVSVTATGTEPIAYAWSQSLDGQTYVPVDGAASAPQLSPSPNQTTWYRVDVNTPCSTQPASTVVKVDVRQPVTMEALTGPDGVCPGESAPQQQPIRRKTRATGV